MGSRRKRPSRIEAQYTRYGDGRTNRITIDPEVCLGQPTIRGMRITISVIRKMLAAGRSAQDILEAYPELEAEDVRQAVQYAAWVVSDQSELTRCPQPSSSPRWS